jgi:hypothetical protein
MGRSDRLISRYTAKRLFQGAPVPDGVDDISVSQTIDPETFNYGTQVNWKVRGMQHSMTIPDGADGGIIAVLVAMRLSTT